MKIMSTRVEQFQNGCLHREARKNGPDVWVFRWRERSEGGTAVHRKQIIGTVEQYPTNRAAQVAVSRLRVTINKGAQSNTVAALVAHYIENELSERSRKPKAHSTRAAYQVYLERWILPEWGVWKLAGVKAVAVEQWLDGLPMTNGSRAKIRNILSALFTHAMRHEWLDSNPIKLVRQSAKRERVPGVLDADEIRRLLAELKDPFFTMVFLAASTGLRVSELLALKWSDINFDAGEIRLKRGIWHQVPGELKTEASRKPVVLDSGLAAVLIAWREQSPYNQDGDWVFASTERHGKQPYWPEWAMRRHVRGAAVRAGITKRIGWHTFRHSYGTLLKANGEDVKTVQESLRHANSRITLDTYVQAVTPAKREAQHKVVEAIAGGAFPRVPERLGSRLVN